MGELLQTRKYTFTVEGETEQWYLLWLKDQINSFEKRKYNVAIVAKVQQNPKKYAKSIKPNPHRGLHISAMWRVMSRFM